MKVRTHCNSTIYIEKKHCLHLKTINLVVLKFFFTKPQENHYSNFNYTLHLITTILITLLINLLIK